MMLEIDREVLAHAWGGRMTSISSFTAVPERGVPSWVPLVPGPGHYSHTGDCLALIASTKPHSLS